jgi:hypothetical protein
MKKVARILFVSVLFFSVIAQNVNSQSDDILFRKHLISSGWNSLFYGVAGDYIFDINGAAAAGLPLIAAGAGVVIPLLTNSSKTITSNQLLLTSHGQSLGWAHGTALGLLINGNDAFETEGKAKLTVGLAALTSMGLGILGNQLGKSQDWSEGQVALYRHYGWVMPFTGFSICAAFSDNARVFGAADLIGGAGGYLLAHQINKWHEYTRGDIRATQALTALNGALGYCIFLDTQIDEEVDFNRKGWLIPTAGVLVGTAAGHLWLKGADLTPQQGMTTVYAASAGAILGAGVALIVNSDSFTTNYLIPYGTGMAAYSFAVISLKNKNAGSAYLPDNKAGNWDFAFMPQNLYLNNKIEQRGYIINGRQVGLQPLFAASLNF